MAALELLARQALKARGLRHVEAIQTLRMYMRETPKEDLIRAINRIRKVELFRILWEAGLDADLQRLVLQRIRELTGR